MTSFSTILANSTALGVFTGSSVFWPGGRTALVINAAQYGASVQLQYNQATVNSSTWVTVNSATIAADAVTEFPVPPGQVRMFSSGSSAGMNAILVRMPY